MALSLAHQNLIQKAFLPLDLSDSKFDEVYDYWEVVTYKRHEFITQSGNIERGFYVVIEGVQAIYLMDQNGDKKVIGFSFDGSFSGIYDSFVKEKSTQYFLEALTPSVMLKMSLKSYNALFERFPEFERWGRIVHMDLLIGRVDREVELITSSAEERFTQFMGRCPPQLKQIPQKYLASYLNMTPETFSRLRKKRISIS